MVDIFGRWFWFFLEVGGDRFKLDGVGLNVEMVMLIKENEMTRPRRKGDELEVDMLDDEPR